MGILLFSDFICIVSNAPSEEPHGKIACWRFSFSIGDQFSVFMLLRVPLSSLFGTAVKSRSDLEHIPVFNKSTINTKSTCSSIFDTDCFENHDRIRRHFHLQTHQLFLLVLQVTDV